MTTVPSKSCFARTGPPSTVGEYRSGSTPLGLTRIRSDDDPPPDQLVAHRAAHDHDEVGAVQVQQLNPGREPLVLQRPPPVTAHPDLRTVVFEDERHAEPPRQPQAGVVVQAVALVDERDASTAEHPHRAVVETRRSTARVGSSLKFQNASGTATRCTSISGPSVGTVAVVNRIGGPTCRASSLSTPAMWPTEPPARTTKLRSVRRYRTRRRPVVGGRRPGVAPRLPARPLRVRSVAADGCFAIASRTSWTVQRTSSGDGDVASAAFRIDDVAAARHQPQRPQQHRTARGREPLGQQPAHPIPLNAAAGCGPSTPTHAPRRPTRRSSPTVAAGRGTPLRTTVICVSATLRGDAGRDGSSGAAAARSLGVVASKRRLLVRLAKQILERRQRLDDEEHLVGEQSARQLDQPPVHAS